MPVLHTVQRTRGRVAPYANSVPGIAQQVRRRIPRREVFLEASKAIAHSAWYPHTAPQYRASRA
eukprot:3940496-Rhodomonas_salina.3